MNQYRQASDAQHHPTFPWMQNFQVITGLFSTGSGSSLTFGHTFEDIKAETRIPSPGSGALPTTRIAGPRKSSPWHKGQRGALKATMDRKHWEQAGSAIGAVGRSGPDIHLPDNFRSAGLGDVHDARPTPDWFHHAFYSSTSSQRSESRCWLCETSVHPTFRASFIG